MSVVVDASVTLSWAFDDETSSFTESVLDHVRRDGSIVPSIWLLEVANALLVSERRKRLAQADTLRFIGLLQTLPITVDDGVPAEAFGPVLTLAREHELSAYDAAYLELAIRRGLPLATQDARLLAAAERAGVRLHLEGRPG